MKNKNYKPISFSIEQLLKAIMESKSWREVSRKLNVSHTGSRAKKYMDVAKEKKIDISHMLGQSWCRGKEIPHSKEWGGRIELSIYLTVNSIYNGGSNALKKRLIKEGILKNICVECGNEGIWNGKELSMHLDHINGINTDNRIENLRILCPNCHSQTDTFGAKKRNK